MITKTFSRIQMSEMDLPWSAIEDEITSQSRWATDHRIVFKDPKEDVYWMTEYAVGSTEL